MSGAAPVVRHGCVALAVAPPPYTPPRGGRVSVVLGADLVPQMGCDPSPLAEEGKEGGPRAGRPREWTTVAAPTAGSDVFHNRRSA